MDYSELDTVEKVATFVKTQVDYFRRFPTKKPEVIAKLKPIFTIESECWPIVIDAGKFRVTFYRKLGKRGMLNLRKLLLAIDSDHYKDIDFEIE